MKPRRLWVRRGALMYAVGTWTVFSYFASRWFFRGREGEKDAEPPAPPPHWLGKENEFPTIVSEDMLIETTVYRSPGERLHVSSQTIHKKDFLPYTTRLKYFLLSFFNESDKKEK